MPEPRIADCFLPQHQFLRSVNLVRDFDDPQSLEGYVLTEQAKSRLRRLTTEPFASKRRAWRITGDYGSGKSSLGLLLANLLGGQADRLPEPLRRSIEQAGIQLGSVPLLPVLVTGTRDRLSIALMKALRTTIEDKTGRTFRDFSSFDAGGNCSDAEIVETITKTNKRLRDDGKFGGMLIVLDELGKFLEFSALYPDHQDVYFLQLLAEAAARSGGTPLIVIGLLHQGFQAYADDLSLTAQREWRKVAERFDELVFDQPLEEISALTMEALRVRTFDIPLEVKACLTEEMRRTVQAGWYGPQASIRELGENGDRLYPLHPTVLPVLSRLFSRYAQNERSLFSFLLSNEPFGLQDFAFRPARMGTLFRLHDLFDYTKVNFGHRLAMQSYRIHWNHIDSVIESFSGGDELSLQILKTVGLLNLVDGGNLVATDESIALSVGRKVETVVRALKTLHKVKRVLYNRGPGGYCLWPHTSVNIDKALKTAERAVGNVVNVRAAVADYLKTRPIVARRHYIQTGNLRHFEVRYVPVSELNAEAIQLKPDSDGLILVPLCETEEECSQAAAFAASTIPSLHPEVLIAVSNPLKNLSKLFVQLNQWKWVGQNTPELNVDPYAAEEVSRQTEAAEQSLRSRIEGFFGFHQPSRASELTWFRCSRGIQVETGRQFLELLSKICDEVFPDSPIIRNELINRRVLSSAAAGARLRLIERMFLNPNETLLGMDFARKPPEMSIYLSLLKNGHLHAPSRSGFALVDPPANQDRCRILPALKHLRTLVERKAGIRIKLAELFDELKKPPFGVREGVIPILLAHYAFTHESELAFYEDDIFMRHLTGKDFMRIVKAPETFEIQYCRVEESLSDVFRRLVDAFQIQTNSGRSPEVLDVVRLLCQKASKYPLFVHKTQRIAGISDRVRKTLVSSVEPYRLLFMDLPRACGLPDFSDSSPDKTQAGAFVGSLKTAFEELDAVYPALLGRLKQRLKDGPAKTRGTNYRGFLIEKARTVAEVAADPRLKSFALRLADDKLSETEWLESVGSVVCAKPPAKWSDEDEKRFHEEITVLSERFLKLNAIHEKGNKVGDSVYLGLTGPDGTEVGTVIDLNEADVEFLNLEEKILGLVKIAGKDASVVLPRVVWNVLSRSGRER